MKESIIIKNLGPLKEVEIRDIKPLTVFIGKSASGKSTIMKIIVLMRYIYKHPVVSEKCEDYPFAIQTTFQLSASGRPGKHDNGRN